MPGIIQAILTGSRIYGKPRADSDLDIAMLVSNSDMARLLKSSDQINEDRTERSEDYNRAGVRTAVIRFGKLNVLATTCPVDFAVWVKGTRELYAEDEPPSRKQEVARFKELREARGIIPTEKK